MLHLCTLSSRLALAAPLAAGLVSFAASLASTAAQPSSSLPSWLKSSSTAALIHTPAHTALGALLPRQHRQQEQQGRVCRKLSAQRKRSGGSRLHWHITCCGSRRERCRKCRTPRPTVLNSCCRAGGWVCVYEVCIGQGGSCLCCQASVQQQCCVGTQYIWRLVQS